MDESQNILKKVGLALVIVGAIDICYMIYCISNKINYSSSFNIFAVITGTLLLKNSIKTARIVTFYSAFMLAGFIGLVFLMFPFLEPLDLRLIQFKLNPISNLLSYIFMFIAIWFVYWVYRNLSSEPVMIARKNAGLSYGTPKLAFAIGGVLVGGLSIAMYFLNHGDSSDIAKSMAEKQYGSHYKYHVSGMNYSGKSNYATLTAYNENEVKSVDVKWND